MTIEYDDKGKFFTDIITKIPIPVIIQTVTHRIHGNIHIRQDQRIKDELDIQEKFMAVTAATVYAPNGKIMHQTNFLAVQRSQIIWVVPEDEITKTAKGSEE